MLSSTSINLFIWTVNRAQWKYQLANVNGWFDPSYYETFKRSFSDDIQILYDGKTQHFITVLYNASQLKLYVYDSLALKRPKEFNELNDKLKQIVYILYPLLKNGTIEYVMPKTIQTDGSSCGLFAMAYATTLILGKDPRYTDIRLIHPRHSTTKIVDESWHMRLHVKIILETGQLALFP